MRTSHLPALLACAVLIAAAAPAPAPPAAFIRINQLGYAPNTAATAYLVSPTPETGAVLRITNASGQIILTQPVGPASGTWAGFTIYPLGFTLPAPGRYKIQVTGPLSAIAPPVTAATPAALFTAPLARALSFYQTERDGPDFLPNALRTAPAHLHDATATAYATPLIHAGKIQAPLVPTGATIDASGGWWDAGDYLKFVQTESYTTAMLLTGIRDFPAQMGAASPADFTAEAKFGLTWLLKMWDDPTRTLYYEVGIGIDFQGQSTLSDHDLWRLPQRDDTLGHGAADYAYIAHRPVFAAGPADAPVSPNLAGRLAAAFALGFVTYRATDTAFAQQCLLAAEHVIDLADTKPGRLLTAIPYGFYPETEWRDDLEWGATELAIALTLAGADLPPGLPHPDPAYYLAQAAQFASAYINGPNDAADTLNLYDVSGLAHFDLIRAIALAGASAPTGALAVTPAQLQADLLKQLSHATKQAAADPFGFGIDWATADTTSHGTGIAVMASEARLLTGDTTWDHYAGAWLANIMGANIWGLSFIIGDGKIFPDCPQHQVANILGSLRGKTPVLVGAAVEGPNATNAVARGFLHGMRACPANGIDRYAPFTGNGARFEDNVQNYVNTEPALDLTAASPLMFAWQIAGAPRDLALGRKVK